MQMNNIVKTPEACQCLGRSKSSLLRYIDVGVLTPGKHFFRGPFRNSPITWDITACQERFGEIAAMHAIGQLTNDNKETK